MIQKRLIQFIEYKGITKYKFYKETGLSNGFLDKKGSIGVDKCEIIYSKYPDINFEWLITGEGSMLKDEKSTPKPAPTDNNSEILDLLRDKIELLEKNNALIEKDKTVQFKEISRLEDENKDLKEEIKEMQEELKHLRNELIEVLKNQNKSDTNSHKLK